LSGELSILKAFCTKRELYESYYEYMAGLSNMEREIKIILRLIHEYYKEFKEEEITKQELLDYYEVLYPAQHDRDVHLDIIHNVFQIKFNEELVVKMLEQVLEVHYSSMIFHKLIPIIEGGVHGKLADVYEDVEEYLNKLKNPPKSLAKMKPCELSLQELIDTEINYEGLNWHLPILDELIGRAKRGKLGLVYAFVDSGKSSFCLSACANFARQMVGTDECIVYAGNEEGAPGLSLRLTQALVNKTKTEMVENAAKYDAQRKELGFERIKLYDSVYTLNDVVYLLEEHHPRIMFVDQAVKVESSKDMEGMKAVQKLFNTYRELAKTYNCTIIGVAQGKGECEDKKYLNLSDIYGSRVAIQGELDWAIGIGRIISDPVYENQRYINIPKNKEGDNAKFVVTFDRHLCQWKEV